MLVEIEISEKDFELLKKWEKYIDNSPAFSHNPPQELADNIATLKSRIGWDVLRAAKRKVKK